MNIFYFIGGSEFFGVSSVEVFIVSVEAVTLSTFFLAQPIKLLYFISMPGSENATAIMFYYVYILQSVKNDSLYAGYTQDLKKRFQEHNRGLNFSTKTYRPWQLIHYEAYLNEKDAKRREKYLKSSQGARLLKRMLKEYFYKYKSKN